MTATTNVTVQPKTWTQLGGTDPVAIQVKSNHESLTMSWRLIVAAAQPAATDIGNKFRAFDSWTGNGITGAVWVYSEGDGPHDFAVTE